MNHVNMEIEVKQAREKKIGVKKKRILNTEGIYYHWVLTAGYRTFILIYLNQVHYTDVLTKTHLDFNCFGLQEIY